jgi:hypothetical protein
LGVPRGGKGGGERGGALEVRLRRRGGGPDQRPRPVRERREGWEADL